jgi:hypothetical protein
MSSMQLRFDPEARKEFREAIVWCRDPNASAAIEFRVAVSEGR